MSGIISTHLVAPFRSTRSDVISEVILHFLEDRNMLFADKKRKKIEKSTTHHS